MSRTLLFSTDYHSLVDWSTEAILGNREGLDSLRRDKTLYDCLLNHDLYQYHCIRKDDINKTIGEYNHIWNSVESDFRTTVEALFGKDISKGITAYITFLPVFPRDLEKRCFLVPFVGSEDYKVSIVFHEYLHFVFFDKLNNYSPSKSIWLVSELLIPLCFAYFRSKALFGKIVSSNYCLNKDSIDKGATFFEEFALQRISFETLVNELELVVKEELL